MSNVILKEFNCLNTLVEEYGYSIDVQHTFSLHNDDTNTYDVMLASPYKRWRSLFSLKNTTLLGALVELEIQAGDLLNDVVESVLFQ